MVILQQLLILFCMMIVGYFIKKLKIVTDNFNKEVSNLIVYVTLPAYLINSMSFSFSKNILLGSKDIFIASILIYIVQIVMAYGFVRMFKINKSEVAVYQFSMVFGNVGFMGYPIVDLLYGNIGVFYTAIFNITFNTLVWTLGVYFYTKDQYKFSLKEFLKSITNPGIVALIIGFVLFLLSIPIPESIKHILNMLGSLTTPLILIYIGTILAKMKLKEILDLKAILLTVFRLIVIPVIIYVLLRILGFKEDLLVIPVILSAMPVATFAAMLAEKYNNDYYLASKLVFVSSFFCIFTLTILLNFM
ncbi:MAG: permease [Clostridia bacterium]|nr:permease [Clostridia bacterium]